MRVRGGWRPSTAAAAIAVGARDRDGHRPAGCQPWPPRVGCRDIERPELVAEGLAAS